MQSNGTLTYPLSFKGKNALFSGPAGGVKAAAAVVKHKGIKGVIGFDMGGISTDVSRFDGTFKKRYEQTIGNIPLQFEMLDIITVAARGGSIVQFDGQRMIAGPESAGAYPGPACYGFGGPLTITDANLLRKADGEISQLGHREVLRAQRGDSIIIQTPGGGGYGRE
jgi:5-oxoprolinase (ATP-hydrolysing)